MKKPSMPTPIMPSNKPCLLRICSIIAIVSKSSCKDCEDNVSQFTGNHVGSGVFGRLELHPKNAVFFHFTNHKFKPFHLHNAA